MNDHARQPLAPSTTGQAAFPDTAMRLHRITVQRGGQTVLHDLTMTIPTGAVTAIIGRSGAGKSTLIRTLNGLTQPQAGHIQVAGLGDLDNPAILRQHRRRTASIFQDHALIDRLSALDNVLLGLADLRHPLSVLPWPKAMQERALAALDEVGLLHRAHQRTQSLSGGERQRVGIARALVRQPCLLLADEPFASVDTSLVIHFSQKLRQTVLRSGLTLVIVLHQLETALAMADRIVGLVDGRIVFNGARSEFDATAQARIFRPFRPKEINHA